MSSRLRPFSPIFASLCRLCACHCNFTLKVGHSVVRILWSLQACCTPTRSSRLASCTPTGISTVIPYCYSGECKHITQTCPAGLTRTARRRLDTADRSLESVSHVCVLLFAAHVLLYFNALRPRAPKITVRYRTRNQQSECWSWPATWLARLSHPNPPFLGHASAIVSVHSAPQAIRGSIELTRSPDKTGWLLARVSPSPRMPMCVGK